MRETIGDVPSSEHVCNNFLLLGDDQSHYLGIIKHLTRIATVLTIIAPLFVFLGTQASNKWKEEFDNQVAICSPQMGIIVLPLATYSLLFSALFSRLRFVLI